MHSLADIWDNFPTISSSTILVGTNIMGVEGSVILPDPDTVLLNTNYGTSSVGTLPAGTPALEWSSNHIEDNMLWDEAMAYCADPANGYTRLPTSLELANAIVSTEFIGGAVLPVPFEETDYWSSSEKDGEMAYIISYTKPYGRDRRILQMAEYKENWLAFRCVR